MSLEQQIRLNKASIESFYLLDNMFDENKFIFDISGSTQNIYKVKLYLKSRSIFCNCPDSKKWCKYYGVICKHCCFVLVKVLNFSEDDEFFKKYILNDEHLSLIKNSFNKINKNVSNDFINLDYIKRYKTLKDNNPDDLVCTHNTIKPDQDTFCSICYEELIDIKNNQVNKQCKVCNIIIHKTCLDKWLSMGKNSCPLCRTIIKSDNSNYYDNLFD